MLFGKYSTTYVKCFVFVAFANRPVSARSYESGFRQKYGGIPRFDMNMDKIYEHMAQLPRHVAKSVDKDPPASLHIEALRRSYLIFT